MRRQGVRTPWRLILDSLVVPADCSPAGLSTGGEACDRPTCPHPAPETSSGLRRPPSLRPGSPITSGLRRRSNVPCQRGSSVPYPPSLALALRPASPACAGRAVRSLGTSGGKTVLRCLTLRPAPACACGFWPPTHPGALPCLPRRHSPLWLARLGRSTRFRLSSGAISSGLAPRSASGLRLPLSPEPLHRCPGSSFAFHRLLPRLSPGCLPALRPEASPSLRPGQACFQLKPCLGILRPAAR